MKKEKKKNLKIILIIIGIIVTIIIALISYSVVNDLKQEDILKKEIINVSNKDFLTDNYDIKVKTTGDYAYIEEAIKKFYQELSINIRTINSYLNNKELINILSAENISSDKPSFTKSYNLLDNTKKNLTTAIQNIANLCKEETIKNLIDKEKVDETSYELYLKLMYTKEDLKSLEQTKLEMEALSNNINAYLDKVKEILNLLKTNSSVWEIKNNQLHFDNNQILNQYNQLTTDLNNIAKNFNNFVKTTKKQSNI